VEVAVVTGASRGIGREVARALERRGLRVLTISRGEAGGEHVAADLARASEVRRAAAAIRAKAPRIDILVNNAAVFAPKRVVTPEGFELTFALNQLAPFLLTRELDPARVVNVSSEAHRRARFDLGDLQSERDYRAREAYANSKLALILFTRELARRGRVAVALHPGIVDTGLLDCFYQDLPWFLRATRPLARPFFTSEEKAAGGVVRLAVDADCGRFSGSYFTGGHVREPAPAAQSDATALVWWEALDHLARRSEGLPPRGE